MHRNDLIVREANAHIRGEFAGPTDKHGKPLSGRCLQLVRQIIERAHRLPPSPTGMHPWYRWLTHPVERFPGAIRWQDDPWARDMERSLRSQNMAVLTPEPGERYVRIEYLYDVGIPGDILFRFDTAVHPHAPGTDPASGMPYWIGHVGIYMPFGMVLENINPGYRSAKTGMTRGPSRLGPVGEWPITLVVRFDPDAVPS